jgi:hypothetical protein
MDRLFDRDKKNPFPPIFTLIEFYIPTPTCPKEASKPLAGIHQNIIL